METSQSHTVEIGTERLVLRPYAMSDAVRLADLISDPCVTQMLSRVPYPYDLQDAEAFIDGRLDSRVGPPGTLPSPTASSA